MLFFIYNNKKQQKTHTSTHFSISTAFLNYYIASQTKEQFSINMLVEVVITNRKNENSVKIIK